MSFSSFHAIQTSKWMHHTVRCCCYYCWAFNIIIFTGCEGGGGGLMLLVRMRWYCWCCFTLILSGSSSVNISIWQMLWLNGCGWWFLSWMMVINHSSCLIQPFLILSFVFSIEYFIINALVSYSEYDLDIIIFQINSQCITNRVWI